MSGWAGFWIGLGIFTLGLSIMDAARFLANGLRGALHQEQGNDR
jgi:hypothetical protein